MIDTDKYEGCIADMKGYDLAILAEELLAEVKRLRRHSTITLGNTGVLIGRLMMMQKWIDWR